MSRIKLPDDTELYYKTVGQAGEPVALLNGVMMTTAGWALQTEDFRQQHRVLLHDFRDQLMRSPATGPYDLYTHVEDFRRVVEHTGFWPLHLVGTSYGGEVAVLFAHRYPQLVRSLTVIASVSEVRPLLHQQVQGWQLLSRYAPELLYQVSAGLNFSDRFLAANPGVVEKGEARFKDLPPTFFAGLYRLCAAFLKLNFTDILPEVAVPTLIIAAEDDRLKPVPYSRLLAERIPRAELAIIPDAGHAVIIERPHLVNQLVLGFIAAHQELSREWDDD